MRPWDALIGLIVASLLALACDGGNEPPSPTGTADLTANLTATIAEPTDIPRTPVTPQSAVSLGRDDCPESWLAHRAEAFTVCFPADHAAELWLPPYDDVYRFSIRLVSDEPITHTPDVLAVWPSDTYEPPTECKHISEHVTEPDSAVIEPYTVGPLTGVSCTALLGDGGQFRGALETLSGSIAFDANATDMDKLDLAKQIVGTVRLEAS